MKIRILAIRKKVREVRNQIGMIVKKDNDLFSFKVLARTSIAEHAQYIQHLLVNIPVVFEPLVHQLDHDHVTLCLGLGCCFSSLIY